MPSKVLMHRSSDNMLFWTGLAYDCAFRGGCSYHLLGKVKSCFANHGGTFIFAVFQSLYSVACSARILGAVVLSVEELVSIEKKE